MGQDRARQRLVDRAVQGLRQRLLASLAEVFTDPIEDDDRIVQRISDDREERGYHRQRNLEMHDLEERERRQKVVRRRDDGSESKTPFKANGQVDQCNCEGDQHCDEGAALELFSDTRANCFAANHTNVLGTELVVQHRLDSLAYALRTAGLLRDRALILRSNRVLAIRSELLNLRSIDAVRVQRASHVGNIGRGLELHLHQRSTRELDALVDRLVHE